MGAQKLFHSNPWLKPEPNGSQWENLHLQSITPSRNGTLPAALRAHSSRLRNGRTQANRYVGAAEKVIDMKLSLPQQLLGAFALAAVLSMGVVAPAAARDNDNQGSEHDDKDKKNEKARANDRQDARRQQAARQPAQRRAGEQRQRAEQSQRRASQQRQQAEQRQAAQRRTEERRVGKECVRTGRYRWAPYH